MVPLCRVPGGFEAQVLAARLGSEGVIVELRGGGMSSMWPGGAVEVLVSEPDLDVARELLLSDEIEEALEGDAAADDRVLPWWVVAVALFLTVTFVLAAFAGRLLGTG